MSDNIPYTFIAKGSYGCIYTPSIPCDKEKSDKNKVSKIQIKDRSFEEEEKINIELRKNKISDIYFILIEKTCKVENIESFKTTCEIIEQKRRKKFINLQMKYVKGKNLIKSLLSESEETAIYTKQKYKYLFKTLLQNILHLIEGISILQDNNMIHWDLHENNIIVDEKSKIPYIIDFGLSMIKNKEKMMYTLSKYKTTPTIDFWCIDIQILLYIITIQNEDLSNTTQIIENIKTIVQSCISNNKILHIFSETFQKKYQEQIENLYADLILKSQHENEGIGKVIDTILEYSHTWDIFTISIIILDMIQRMFLKERNKFTNEKIYSFPNHIFLQDLIKILMQNIHPDQTKRYTCKEFKDKIEKLFEKQKDDLLFV